MDNLESQVKSLLNHLSSFETGQLPTKRVSLISQQMVAEDVSYSYSMFF